MTKSAAFFAVRVLADPDAPPSAGAHRPDRGRAPPEGCLLNARPPAAVAAGNVETSSRVADLVIAALAGASPAPAQGQGTMNNLTLAGEDFTYYETIGGGQGACPDADGPSAIHVAMSNTLNTPVEALETEFPSGSASSRCGAAAAAPARTAAATVVREIEALAPMRFTLITERRRHAPRGRDGGARRRAGPQPAQRRGAPAEGRRASSRPGDGCGSRRQAAAARSSADPALSGIPDASDRLHMNSQIWQFRLPSLYSAPSTGSRQAPRSGPQPGR